MTVTDGNAQEPKIGETGDLIGLWKLKTTKIGRDESTEEFKHEVIDFKLKTDLHFAFCF